MPEPIYTQHHYDVLDANLFTNGDPDAGILAACIHVIAQMDGSFPSGIDDSVKVLAQKIKDELES